MTETDEKFYSANEVAKRYRVTRKTVTEWIRDGFLPGAAKKGPHANSPYEVPQSALNHLDSLRNQSSDD